MFKTLIMTDIEFQEYIDSQKVVDDAFINQSFLFWFEDQEHIRSPFPETIKSDLKTKTHRVFMEWVYELNQDELEEMKDEDYVEMFENILFNQASQLVDPKDIDTMITLNYPFLPRLGDSVEDEKEGTSRVVRREIQKKDDEKVYMTLSLENKNHLRWESKFVLPA